VDVPDDDSAEDTRRSSHTSPPVLDRWRRKPNGVRTSVETDAIGTDPLTSVVTERGMLPNVGGV